MAQSACNLLEKEILERYSLREIELDKRSGELTCKYEFRKEDYYEFEKATFLFGGLVTGPYVQRYIFDDREFHGMNFYADFTVEGGLPRPRYQTEVSGFFAGLAGKTKLDVMYKISMLRELDLSEFDPAVLEKARGLPAHIARLLFLDSHKVH